MVLGPLRQSLGAARASTCSITWQQHQHTMNTTVEHTCSYTHSFTCSSLHPQIWQRTRGGVVSMPLPQSHDKHPLPTQSEPVLHVSVYHARQHFCPSASAVIHLLPLHRTTVAVKSIASSCTRGTWYVDVARGLLTLVALELTNRPGLMPRATSAALYPSIKPWCTTDDSTNRAPVDPNADRPEGSKPPNANASAPASKWLTLEWTRPSLGRTAQRGPAAHRRSTGNYGSVNNTLAQCLRTRAGIKTGHPPYE